MAAQTTTLMSNEIMAYYESRFLSRSEKALVHGQGSQKQTLGKNKGKSITFNRYTPLADATTPLTEGANPSESALTSSTVTATLSEYGNAIKISKMLSLTSIDREGEEKADLIGQNMGETLDTLTRDVLYAGATPQIVNGKVLTAVGATDVLDYDEVRKAVRTLRNNNAPVFDDGFYMGKIGPYTEYDLMNDTTWKNAHTYSDTKQLYRGEAGELGGVRFVRGTNQKSEASTTTVYSNFIHGKEAFGEYDLEGDMPKFYVKTPGPHSTDNSADRFSTMAWAGAFVAKVLIANWIINVKTGATA